VKQPPIPLERNGQRSLGQANGIVDEMAHGHAQNTTTGGAEDAVQAGLFSEAGHRYSWGGDMEDNSPDVGEADLKNLAKTRYPMQVQF
jgi:hypothetical protein